MSVGLSLVAMCRTTFQALALACFGLGVGCMTGDGMQAKLRDASASYQRAIRWGDIDRAAEWLPNEAQSAFMERHDALETKLVIVDYEVTRLDLDKKTGIASSRSRVTWHTDRSTIVEVTTVDQVWQFFEGDFVLVDERRTGGSPLGMFAEASEPLHPYLPGLERYRRRHEIGKDQKRSSRKRRDAQADD